jgi:hypothetical protein
MSGPYRVEDNKVAYTHDGLGFSADIQVTAPGLYSTALCCACTVLREMPPRGGILPKMLKISNGLCELTVGPTGL